MRRPSYRAAVQWIADNDEPAEREAETLAGLVSVVLVADLFGVEPARVVGDVLKARKP